MFSLSLKQVESNQVSQVNQCAPSIRRWEDQSVANNKRLEFLRKPTETAITYKVGVNEEDKVKEQVKQDEEEKITIFNAFDVVKVVFEIYFKERPPLIEDDSERCAQTGDFGGKNER